MTMEATIAFRPETYHVRKTVALYLSVTRVIFNCFHSSVVTFLHAKKRIKSCSCLSYIQKKLVTKFMIWRPKFYLLVTSWLPNEKVNFEP